MRKLHLAAFLAMATAVSMAQQSPKAKCDKKNVGQKADGYVCTAQGKWDKDVDAAAPSTPPTTAPPVAAPVIPAEMRAEFYKYLAQLSQSQAAVTAAQQRLQQAQQQMQSVCGVKWVLGPEPGSNDPACLPLPAAAK